MVSCSFSLNKSCLGIAKITIINVLLMLAARWFGEREVHLTKCGSSAGGSRDEVAMDLGELIESGKHHIYIYIYIYIFVGKSMVFPGSIFPEIP